MDKRWTNVSTSDWQASKEAKKNGKESPTQQNTKLTGGTICTSSSCTLAAYIVARDIYVSDAKVQKFRLAHNH